MSVYYLPYGEPRKPFCRLVDLIAFGCSPDNLGTPHRVADLGPDSHLILYMSSRALLFRPTELRCRVSVIMAEPRSIQGRYYRLILAARGRFHRIFTHDSTLLAACPNARFYPASCAFIRTPYPELPVKTRRLSLLASSKRTTTGHRMRHRIAKWSLKNQIEIDLLGSGSWGGQWLEHKSDAHLPYQYSVVIENSQNTGYFTEKLIDCLLCCSLPIYWGAPDIAHFFDPRGMILCRSEQELQAAIVAVTAAEYQRRLPFLKANRLKAENYASPLVYASQTLEYDSVRAELNAAA